MLLVGAGKLITRDPAQPFLENGCVAMDEKGLIAAVGDTDALKARYPGAEFLDAAGCVIMPGLINAHNHIYSAFARGLSVKGYAPKGFLDVLEGMWWTLDRNLSVENTMLSAQACFIECVENGVTTVIDHHAGYGGVEGSLAAIAGQADRFGLRACLCYEVSDREGPELMRRAVAENTGFMEWAAKQNGDKIFGMMGMHAQFTLSNETLEYCMSRIPQGAGCHIHVAEGIDDVCLCLKEHGKRPVFRLHDHGVLGENTILGHCTHVSEAEMDLIKGSDTMVVHNPESNMGNAVGCPPVLSMVQKGILIGLGTDGYTQDMLESYKVANLLHKHNLCDPAAAWGEIPEMLFGNNARMCGRMMEKPVGILKEGAHGDLIVVDYDPPTPMDESNINGHILFGMNGRMVRDTVAGGKILMRDRTLTLVDKAEILAKCREGAKDLWARING